MTLFVEASLNTQKSIRALLIENAAITALVPAANIFDRHDRPEIFPSIILGDDQVVDETREINAKLTRERVYSNLHIWVREPSFEGVKTIAGAIKRTLDRARPIPPDNSYYIRMNVTGARYLRDPDGRTSHGIISIETDLQWGWSVEI